MQMTTVFDGLIPASLNPGIDPGAAVVVWTPTIPGVYRVMITAPDEVGTPFQFLSAAIFDPNADIPLGLQGGDGELSAIVANADDESLTLASSADHAIRVVVQIEAIAQVGDAAPIGTAGTKIVPLAVLKRALDIEADDESFDQLLIDLESRAAAYVERMTSRRWSVAIAAEKVVAGRGSRILWLPGHVDGANPVVTVRERAIYGGVWEVLDPDEYEVRDGESLVRLDGSPWSKYAEYELAFLDGYPDGGAPQDIQDLVIDLVSISYSGFVDDGVKSESIGDYSYTLDASVATAASSMSSTSTDTMNRRRPLHV